jgi:ketosteroid isomerase-like protein
MATTTESVVRRYYEIVGDLTYTEDDLASVLHPDSTLVEHPNPVSPHGARRGLRETLDGFTAGRSLLSEQSFEIHELLTNGDRAAVRAVWRGAVGQDIGPYKKGLEMTAHVAAFVTVRDGLVLEHETFDCYEPFASA